MATHPLHIKKARLFLFRINKYTAINAKMLKLAKLHLRSYMIQYPIQYPLNASRK